MNVFVPLLLERWESKFEKQRNEKWI